MTTGCQAPLRVCQELASPRAQSQCFQRLSASLYKFCSCCTTLETEPDSRQVFLQAEAWEAQWRGVASQPSSPGWQPHEPGAVSSAGGLGSIA